MTMPLRSPISVSFLLALAVSSGVGSAEKAAPAISESEARLDKVIALQMSEGGVVGLGAAILVDGEVAWSKGYGYADRATSRPFTVDTPLNIGSISKTFTGAAMMRAVQEGLLSLDEDVNRYLPFKLVNPHRPQAQITLRHLATHTSGISDRWPVYRETYHYGVAKPPALEAFLRDYFEPGGAHFDASNFLDAAPGSQREYSNIGAGLAGHIVERAVGARLNDYTREHIFEPLQMRSSAWFLTELSADQHSRLYVAQGGLSSPIELYEGTTYPDGGVRTSVADLSKFFAALLGHGEYQGVRVLDREHADEMLRWQFTADDKPDNVSLDQINSGLFWASKRDVTRMGHGGSDPGIRTQMLATLDRKLAVVWLSNTSVAGEDERYLGLIDRELWRHAEVLGGR
jgi:CubicO group peptidase (beta-lactamase class C family)